MVAILVGGVRTLGGQTSPEEHQPITAAAVQVHVLTFLWVCIYLSIWVRR